MANCTDVTSGSRPALQNALRVACAALLGLLSGCAVMGVVGLDIAPINGRIVDSSNGKPIEGAYIILNGVSAGAALMHSRTSCPFLEVTRSDADGRYSFPKAPRADREDYYRSVSAYVPGFEYD